MSTSPNRSSPDHQAPIPEELRVKLENFKSSLWRIKIAEACLAGLFGLIISFLIVFTLDRFIETPHGVRLVILVIGVSVFALFAPYWIHRWVYGHRHEGQIARLIAKKFPSLGDRLLGAVELQDQTEAKGSLSPELRIAAMRNVARDMADRDLQQALPDSNHRKWFLAVLCITGLTTIAILNFPNAGSNALKRWLLPLSETPRYTYTQLDLSQMGDPEYVPYGEPFQLTIPLAESSIRSPKTARAKYGKDAWIEAPLSDKKYTFQVPGQRTPDQLSIEADDAIHSVSIEPVMRPTAKSIRAAITMPAYLQRPDISADLRSGFITVLEGSSMSIQTTVSRELKSAHASIKEVIEETISIETPESNTEIEKAIPKAPLKLSLQLKDNQINTDTFAISGKPLIIPITWQGKFGISSDKPLQIKIENVADQAPSSYMNGVTRQHIMLAEETVSFEVICEDDYGIKACGIQWLDESTQNKPNEDTISELTLSKGNPTQTSLNIPFSFSPANLGIEPQKVLLRSWTEDYKPGRPRSYSEPIVLYILTPDEHAQVLKNDFDKIVGELEEVAREEQNLNDENQRIARKEDQKLLDTEGRKKLQEQELAEEKNQERMEKLSKQMEELFKSSVRNGEIEKDTLKKMSKAMQSMKELSDQDLPKVEQKLQDAQKKENSADQAKEKLQEAIEEQKKAIEKMKQALKDANDAKKQFEAGTFVNRLKRAAREQNSIAGTFISLIDKIIGSESSELDPVEQRALAESSLQQRKTALDVRWIQEDLSNYFKRTANEEHQKTALAMRESGIDESLKKLTGYISDNKSVISIGQAKKWSAQLAAWAKELEGEKPGSGGGGGGGGAPSQEDQDFEFMLKVMRMIQKEQDIRERTRSLENLYRTLDIEKNNPPIKALPALPSVEPLENLEEAVDAMEELIPTNS